MGTVVITALRQCWLTNILIFSTYGALDLLNFVQLVPFFRWEYNRKGAGIFLETKSLENTGQKSVGQKTSSSATQKNHFFLP